MYRMTGPFPIIRVINPVTVELKLPSLLGRVPPAFQSSSLKPIEATRIRPQPKPPGPMRADHYEIDRVLDSRLHRGKPQYSVRWKGYPTTEASWVPLTASGQNGGWDWSHIILQLLTLLCYVFQVALVEGNHLSSPVHGLATPGGCNARVAAVGATGAVADEAAVVAAFPWACCKPAWAVTDAS